MNFLKIDVYDTWVVNTVDCVMSGITKIGYLENLGFCHIRYPKICDYFVMYVIIDFMIYR